MKVTAGRWADDSTGDRTQNLWFRRPAPYPLGHGVLLLMSNVISFINILCLQKRGPTSSRCYVISYHHHFFSKTTLDTLFSVPPPSLARYPSYLLLCIDREKNQGLFYVHLLLNPQRKEKLGMPLSWEYKRNNM